MNLKRIMVKKQNYMILLRKIYSRQTITTYFLNLWCYVSQSSTFSLNQRFSNTRFDNVCQSEITDLHFIEFIRSVSRLCEKILKFDVIMNDTLVVHVF